MNKCKECVHYKNDCEFSKSEPTNGEYIACGQFKKDCAHKIDMEIMQWKMDLLSK